MLDFGNERVHDGPFLSWRGQGQRGITSICETVGGLIYRDEMYSYHRNKMVGASSY